MEIDVSEFEDLIRRAFKEDFAHRDITTLACIPVDTWAHAEIVLKKPGCLAGLAFVPRIFHLLDPLIQVHPLASDGELKEPSSLAKIEGPARSLLSAERVALNFLQHLCGIATLTARCVAETHGTSCQILDTRKTILGLRSLQKYAVRMGGGTNHRFHLSDRILIKNNHLALSPDSIRKARLAHPQNWIEVEIGSIDQLKPALDAAADAILLDNMNPEEVRACVLLAQKKAYLEASGGITLENLRSYALTGIDGISMGALTHSAPALDISLRIKPMVK